MTNEFLYQVRIKVRGELSNALRTNKPMEVSERIFKIGSKHGTYPVCTYDAFCDYCREAEEIGIDKYPLYNWTKRTIEDPAKKQKHIKSFAFYTTDSQVYEKSLAKALHDDLMVLFEKKLIEDLTLIDSNPQNNPQPPKGEIMQANSNKLGVSEE